MNSLCQGSLYFSPIISNFQADGQGAGTFRKCAGLSFGLFFATLAKTADPSREVVVFDRNRADDTFGFGVVFSDATLAGIHAADPVLRTALNEHGVHWDTIEVRLKSERLRCAGNGMAAIRRQTLLSLLQRASRTPQPNPQAITIKSQRADL